MQCLQEEDSPAWNYEEQMRSQEAIVDVMRGNRLRWHVGGGGESGDSYCRQAAYELAEHSVC